MHYDTLSHGVYTKTNISNVPFTHDEDMQDNEHVALLEQ